MKSDKLPLKGKCDLHRSQSS